MISQELSEKPGISHLDLLKSLATRLDGSWNICYLDANGEMFVSRDPLGMRPLCYAVEGALFASASESVALTHLGFEEDSITNVPPGYAVLVDTDGVRVEKFAESPKKAHCFFEWIYFANAGSHFDNAGVYLSRNVSAKNWLAGRPSRSTTTRLSFPVTDTAKAAADSMAYQLKVPSLRD